MIKMNAKKIDLFQTMLFTFAKIFGRQKKLSKKCPGFVPISSKKFTENPDFSRKKNGRPSLRGV